MASHHKIGKRNKKGFFSMQQIIVIVLATVSFVLIAQLSLEAMTKIEEKSSEEICRASIAVRERAKIEKFGMEFKTVPLLCKTQDKEIPYATTAKPDEVKKNIADLMARCWWMFAEGQTKDMLEGTIGGDNACFMCYSIKTKKTKEFTETIPANELVEYMIETPYKVTRDDDNCKDLGGHCVSEKSECDLGEGWKYDADNKICKSEYKDKKNCCYSRFTCLNKGGKCLDDGSEEKGWHLYNEWSCPANKKCYIADEHFYSYVDYIQSWGGQGLSIVTTDIAPGGTYTISYGEDNQDCGAICSFFAAAGGVTGAAAVGVGLAKVVGVSAIVLSGPAGWFIAGTAVAVGAAGGAGLSYLAANKAIDVVQVITERDLNTIYLSTPEQMHGNCEMNYGIGGE